MLTNKFIPFFLALGIHAILLICFVNTRPVITLPPNDSTPLSHAIDLKTFHVLQKAKTNPNPSATSKSSPSEAIGQEDQSNREVDDGVSATATTSATANTAGIGPSFIYFREPAYPMIARKNGHEGKVKIRAHYNLDGAITKVEIISSSGIKMLDETVLKSAKDWRLSTGSAGSFEKTFEFKLSN